MPKIRDIVGHAAQVAQLTDDLDSGNVAHAYLFSGPDHVGKATLAHWFAWRLLSVDCNETEKDAVCRQVENLLHPDLLVLDQLWIEGICEDWNVIAQTSNVSQVHRSKKPAAKTNTISIDDIRTMHNRLIETGTGKWRCCIIHGVERMQEAAASAFLKILEEPPPSLVFLLTTSAKQQLLPTIVSRTRQLNLQRLSSKELKPLLVGMSEDETQFILHIARGAPGIVGELRDRPEKLREHRLVHNAAESFWTSASLRERIQILAPLSARGEAADRLLLHLNLTMREKSPNLSLRSVTALQELADGLQTNVHRGLLAQRFALEWGC